MRKHQYVKVDCHCKSRATYFKCKHCDSIVYKSEREIRILTRADAECHSPAAPMASAQEKFKSLLGNPIDCLAPDFKTYMDDKKRDKPDAETCVNC